MAHRLLAESVIKENIMADNYLETRYEEVFGAGAKSKNIVKRVNVSLNTLLVKNRSTRRYRQDVAVLPEQLKSIVEVNTKLASAMNRQALRFRLVTTAMQTTEPTLYSQSYQQKNLESSPSEQEISAAPSVSSTVTGSSNSVESITVEAKGEAGYPVYYGAEQLRNILFREPMRPEAANAFIIVYSVIPEDRYVDIDLGISLQSMSLKAVEMGFNCLIKGNIDKSAICSMFGDSESGMQLHPLAALCIGKSAESIYLKPTDDVSNLEPYTKDSVHYVPKLELGRLLI